VVLQNEWKHQCTSAENTQKYREDPPIMVVQLALSRIMAIACLKWKDRSAPRRNTETNLLGTAVGQQSHISSKVPLCKGHRNPTLNQPVQEIFNMQQGRPLLASSRENTKLFEGHGVKPGGEIGIKNFTFNYVTSVIIFALSSSKCCLASSTHTQLPVFILIMFQFISENRKIHENKPSINPSAKTTTFNII
jgi:hypothetical protein